MSNSKMNVDRLSNLPEAIILHILTLMDIKYAIRTCVLSKQWCNLWTYLPSLNFYSDSFRSKATFKNFLLHVFTHYDASKLRSCSLLCRGKVDQTLMEAIINYAVSNQVKHLSICSPVGVSRFQIPSRLLTCGSLTSLLFEGLFFVDSVQQPFAFASLTTLHLDRFSIYKGTSNGHFFSSCTNLENLVLTKCSLFYPGDFVISCPKLVTLTMSYTYLTLPLSMKIRISAPRLTHFNFAADCNVKMSLDVCPALESVKIHFYNSSIMESTRDQHKRLNFVLHLINIMKELRDAKSFTLSMDTMKALKVKMGSMNIESITITSELMAFLLGGFPQTDVEF